MFARQRHDAFVSGDDEQGGVYAADTGQHFLNEVAMTGDIYNANGFAVGQVEPGEAQVNGHLAALLFREPVGVDAAQFCDKRGFAVIDMPGGADNAHRSGAVLAVDRKAIIAQRPVSAVANVVFMQHRLIAFAVEIGAGAFKQPQSVDAAA